VDVCVCVHGLWLMECVGFSQPVTGCCAICICCAGVWLTEAALFLVVGSCKTACPGHTLRTCSPSILHHHRQTLPYSPLKHHLSPRTERTSVAQHAQLCRPARVANCSAVVAVHLRLAAGFLSQQRCQVALQLFCAIAVWLAGALSCTTHDNMITTVRRSSASSHGGCMPASWCVSWVGWLCISVLVFRRPLIGSRQFPGTLHTAQWLLACAAMRCCTLRTTAGDRGDVICCCSADSCAARSVYSVSLFVSVLASRCLCVSISVCLWHCQYPGPVLGQSRLCPGTGACPFA
jgi:hypothetical protein